MLKVPFRALPGRDVTVGRPVLDIYVEGIERTPLGCLLDTGSLHNRFGAWVARAAGIDIANAPRETIVLGGVQTEARTVPAGLRLAEHRWEAPVSFCDPWPWDFNLLGQEGFLRWFRVCISAADHQVEITAETV